MLPLDQWTLVTMDSFDSSCHVVFNSQVDTTKSRLFYVLRMP